MGAAYSQDLRRKVVDAYAQREGSMRVLARRFKVSLGFVRDLLKRYRATGTLKPKAYRRGAKPKVDEAGEHFLRELIQQEPALPLWELSERYEQRWGVAVSKSALDRTLRRLKITRKKTALRSTPRQRTGSRVTSGVSRGDRSGTRRAVDLS
jgi:putative transposase